jgi:hypothetical protein
MKRDRATRDAALKLLEDKRADYLARARRAAEKLYGEHFQPISVEDVRRVCPPPPDIDPRVMGAVLHHSMWTPVGWEMAGGHCNTRPVRLMMPKSEMI